MVIEEKPWIGAVGADAADHRRQMNEDVRARILIKPQRFRLFAEVVLAAARHGNFPAADRAQFLHNERSEEAAASTYNHTPIIPVAHPAPLVLGSPATDGLHHTRDGIVPPVPAAAFLFQNGIAFSPGRTACRF